MRQARYDLAQALLAEGDVRVTEAVEQLDLAVSEIGSEPATWELLQLGARSIRDVTPAEAVARYVRSLRHQAPDSAAHEAREWAESLRLGTLRLSLTATDGLLEEPTTPARQLLAATLLRSVGDSERAHVIIGTIHPTSDVREPLAALDIHCLIDLGDFPRAERALNDPAYTSVLSDRGTAFLRARLAFTRRDFTRALDFFSRLEDAETDEIAAIRNLAYVGAGRATEVQWSSPETDKPTGPETWLSRAVAALASKRYDDAQAAASWAERFLPESLSVLLLKAQAQLEKIEDGKLDQGILEQGLAMLELVAKGSSERGREPFWLERQRVVRSSDRFAYVECEYEHLKGVLNLERIRTVDRSKTTYYQDGRLAEIEASAYRSGPEWATAMDRSVSAYQTADAYTAALPLAEEVFRAEPSLARAIAFGWVVYGWSDPDNDTASNQDPLIQVQRLSVAIRALEESLPEVANDDPWESLRLITALMGRKVGLLEHDVIAAGAEASPWVFANAITAADDPWSQVMLEWFIRNSFDIETASFEIAEYAGTLDPSLPMTLETRLIARTNLFGVDKKTHELLKEIERQAEDGSPDVSNAQWCRGVELRLAVLDGDLRRVRELVDADVGEFPWALEQQACAKILLDGIDAAIPVLARIREVLRRSPTTKLSQALLAALSGDHDEADALVAAAREEGNDLAADIDQAVLILQCARHRDRPLLDFADELIARSRTKADLQWLERMVFPALMVLRGNPPGQGPIGERIAQRYAELETEQIPWADELVRRDAVLGALAILWRAMTRHDLREMAAVLRQLEAMEVPGAFHFILGGVCRSTRTRLADEVLYETVAAVAGGSEPDQDLADQVLAGLTAPSATVARALAGIGGFEDHPADDVLDAGAGAFIEAVRRCGDGTDALWEMYDAAGTLRGKFADLWRPVLRDRLLDLLGSMVRLDARPAYDYRSYLSFVLGGDFIPEDTGERWALVSEYIPALRDSIHAATGYRIPIPGFNVRADRSADATNILHLLLHDVIFGVRTACIQECTCATRVTRSHLTLGKSRSPIRSPGPSYGTACKLSRRRRALRSDGCPLQFAMRYVERFVRDHLANMVTVRDVVALAELAGPEAAREFRPVCILRWLAEGRREIRKGTPPEEVEAMSRAIAERVRQSGDLAGPATGAIAAQPSAKSRSRP